MNKAILLLLLLSTHAFAYTGHIGNRFGPPPYLPEWSAIPPPAFTDGPSLLVNGQPILCVNVQISADGQVVFCDEGGGLGRFYPIQDVQSINNGF